MKNVLINALIFAAGAGIGSVVTWKIVKTKYEKIANEEIASVKEYYAQREAEKEEACYEGDEIPISEVKPDPEEVVKKEYKELIEQNEYSNEEIEDVGTKPYVISPDEFGELDDYTIVSLNYYQKDNVLADDYNQIIKNVDELVGKRSLQRFGEYEEDSVFVRNEMLKTDYEILLDIRSFKEAREFDRRLSDED